MVDAGSKRSMSLRHALAILRTNIAMVALILGALAAGSLFVLLSTDFHWNEVLLAFGTGLIAVAALSIALEVFLRRRLTEEVLSAVDIREGAARADIKDFLSGTSEYIDGFATAIKASRDVDIMFVSAQRWLENHWTELLELLRTGGRVRVLIPSPDDQPLLDQLLTRFEYPTTEGVARVIATTLDSVKSLRAKYPPETQEGHFPDTAAANEQVVLTEDGGKHELIRGVSIRRLSVVPSYSLYRMGKVAVMRVHEVRKERADETPVIVFGDSGTLWKFVTTDFTTLFDAAPEYP
ncbi:hypothetical protein [Homoserinibacter sp. GY 40078]|uniref:hypothetical protein n=1 Tax=Homoserinibacter sp. GY 40078 TaxID=2603275 RepID=UPI0011CC7475|nr:hypothetical protein [Homoserinibacter sp. GY 40078]TXK18683.1 hypothetical protein FVQ89_01690 [Homoserinibacter sp. GY 40078]